jgi:hypothetical protein
MHEKRNRWFTVLVTTAILIGSANAQVFTSSGSTGVDGDLIVAKDLTFTTLPKGGGNIYNFKTIQIAAGATLRLSGSVFPNPLYFLAQGAVTIAGTIDLNGDNGSTVRSATASDRVGPTVPGAGGYGGGPPLFGANAQLPGFGPAGGGINQCSSSLGGGGGFTGNQFLVPLVGGSGGGGSSYAGGAGGGALLIASSVSITITGTVTAKGGDTSNTVPPDQVYSASGAGAGGGIRLVAPLVTGTGLISSVGGFVDGRCTARQNGIVRLEANQNTFSGSVGGTYYTATPGGLFLPSPTGQPSIVVTSVGGISVNTSPTGAFTVPDVTVNSTSPLTAQIQAANVPTGTIPTLYILTENFPDQKIVSTPLAGTLATSSATATVTLPPGYSKGFITATWTQ